MATATPTPFELTRLEEIEQKLRALTARRAELPARSAASPKQRQEIDRINAFIIDLMDERGDIRAAIAGRNTR